MLMFWDALREAARRRNDKKNQISPQLKICFYAKNNFIQNTKKGKVTKIWKKMISNTNEGIWIATLWAIPDENFMISVLRVSIEHESFDAFLNVLQFPFFLHGMSLPSFIISTFNSASFCKSLKWEMSLEKLGCFTFTVLLKILFHTTLLLVPLFLSMSAW